MTTTRDYVPELDSNRVPYSDKNRDRSSNPGHKNQGKRDKRSRPRLSASEKAARDERCFRRLLRVLTPVLTRHWASAAYLLDATRERGGVEVDVHDAFVAFSRHQEHRGGTSILRRDHPGRPCGVV